MEPKHDLVGETKSGSKNLGLSENEMNTMRCPTCNTIMDLDEESNVFICGNCHRALLNEKVSIKRQITLLKD